MIPKFFYKVVVCGTDESKLSAAAFLMSQEDLLATIDRLREEKLTEAEAQLFQVSVGDIETLTGLDLGPLRQADTRVEEVAAGAQPRLIDRLEDIRLV